MSEIFLRSNLVFDGKYCYKSMAEITYVLLTVEGNNIYEAIQRCVWNL